MWDAFQQSRLALEKQIIEEQHPGCDFVIGPYSAFIYLWHVVAGDAYKLRVEINTSYPDQKPRVYVEYPVPLQTYWAGKKISDFAPSHNFHVLSTSSGGEVQICHFSDGDWDATKTIHLVIIKAKLWLQAYGEHHLRTGRPICDFFGDCT